jgi:hypothetical protein
MNTSNGMPALDDADFADDAIGCGWLRVFPYVVI